MIKFSVVIINRNQRELISTAIASALSQSYSNLEVILVDDASTDGSQDVEKTFSSDHRYRTIFLEENVGTMCARLTGIDAATGDYLLLVDGDDALAPDTCSRLANILTEKSYDIVAFGAELVIKGPCSQLQAKNVQSVLYPCEGLLIGEDITAAAFIEHRMLHTVWGRCYRLEFLQRAIRSISREFLIYNEDFYFFFVVSSFAESYFGIPDKLYRYSYGSGISTSARLSMEQYEQTLLGVRSNQLVSEFAISAGLFQRYEKILRLNMEECAYAAWLKLGCLAPQDLPLGRSMMFQRYDACTVISALARLFRFSPEQVSDTLGISEHFRPSSGSVQKILLVCPPIPSVQDVLDRMSKEMSCAGLETVMVFDGSEELCLNCSGENYSDRFHALAELIEKHGADAVLFTDYSDEDLFWDLCTVKSTGSAFIFLKLQAGLQSKKGSLPDLSSVFRHSDLVLTCSDLDYSLCVCLNPGTRRICLPLDIEPCVRPVLRTEEPVILFPTSYPGYPLALCEALDILRNVLNDVPETKLYIIPSGNARESGSLPLRSDLDGHVVLLDHEAGISGLNSCRTVCLYSYHYNHCSDALVSCLKEGIPIISRYVPGLFGHSMEGCYVKSGSGNIVSTAQKISQLLLDPACYESAVNAALNRTAEISSAESPDWVCIMNISLAEDKSNPELLAQRSYSTFEEYFTTANEYFSLLEYSRKSNCEAMTAYSELLNSRRYKLGSAIVYLPRKVIGAFRKAKDS